MASLAQLEIYTSELTVAVKNLATHLQSSDPPTGGGIPLPMVPPEAPSDAHRARRSILANIAKIQALLNGTADFLHQLAVQNQLLACLQWLGDFQVLACIPLGRSVPLKDLAELAGVPETQLCRVMRMMATTGFLHEPQPGLVTHTALSAPFVSQPSYLDAVMFLAGTAAPVALQMATATQRFGHSQTPNESAYNVALNTSVPFASAREQQPKLQRQWPAYLRYGMGVADDAVTEILKSFTPIRLANASVVEVGATSTERAEVLANLNPTLHLTVQMSGPTTQQLLNSRITVQQKAPGSPQTVLDAAVYILHLPSSSSGMPADSRAADIVAELRTHTEVLRANSSATLVVLTPRLLPESGTMAPQVETIARLRDLSLMQLTNEREIEMSELMNMLNSVGDSVGRLVLVSKLHLCNNLVGLEVRYQAYVDR